MTTARTADLIARMPSWFIEQARAMEALARRRQLAWEEDRRRNNAMARGAGLGAAASTGGRDDWPDTVALGDRR